MGRFAIVLFPLLAFVTADYTATISAYPDYSGSYEISGDVVVGEESEGSTTLVLTYALTGLETSTSGGIHIHEGTTCSIADLVGGHYYGDAEDSDPWTTTWTSDSAGEATGVVSIDADTLLEDNYGHALVIHESNGDRAACGLIGSAEYVATLVDYPDYDGNTVSGTIAVSETLDNEILVNYDLDGLETSTSGGIHIHEGMTCVVADWVSGHYYDSDSTDDPWTTEWTSDEDGASSGNFSLDSGYNSIDENLGHALVIHDSDGTRVACGLIGEIEEYLVTLDVYPDYTGDYDAIGGYVVVAENITESSSLTVTYDLYNLETDTSGGIHIHEGTSCDSADSVGGHYYDVDSDPWTTEWDTTDNEGNASGSFSIYTGYSIEDNYGHALVIHESDGTRASCGLIGAVEITVGDHSISETALIVIIVVIVVITIILCAVVKVVWSRKNYKPVK